MHFLTDRKYSSDWEEFDAYLSYQRLYMAFLCFVSQLKFSNTTRHPIDDGDKICFAVKPCDEKTSLSAKSDHGKMARGLKFRI